MVPSVTIITDTQHGWRSPASAHDIQQMLDKNKHVDLVNMLRRIDTPNGMDKLSLTLLRDMHTVLISDMLVKIDRTSMHAGVEVRSPFLDHRVAEMAMAIDGKHKIAWRQGKKILRDIFINDLPKTVFDAPKRGFEMPLNDWLCGPLAVTPKACPVSGVFGI